ncbi:MAG TPA: CPBP family intramembrane glutamic endopeptidase, partial [Armatimonadota bacterium]
MRRLCGAIALVIAACILSVGVHGCAAAADAGVKPSVRDFSVRHDQPRVSGYAEIDYQIHRSNDKHASIHHKVWFEGRDKYRIESRTVSKRLRQPGDWNYFINDRSHFYYGMALGGPTHRVRWFGYPSELMDAEPSSFIDTFLQVRDKIESPVLVANERVLGLQTEHWRGIYPGRKDRKTNVDVWVSTDPRYPMILRREHRSSDGRWTSWRVTKLDLSHALPTYLFTAQVHPKGGLIAARSMAYKPTLLYLTWHLLALAALAGIAFSAYFRPERRAAVFRITGIIACVVFLLGLGASYVTMYCLSFNDTLVGAFILVMYALFVLFMVRVLGLPSGMKIAKGTTWWSMLFVLGAAVLMGISSHSYQQRSLVHEVGRLSWHMPFSFPILLNVALFLIGSAFASELVFRGYLYGVLEKYMKSTIDVIVVQALVSSLYVLPAL